MAFSLTGSFWFCVCPILKPVQFVLNFFPIIKENSKTYYNIAFIVGIVMIYLLYYLFLKLLKIFNRDLVK